jgi:hypothetical protein
MGLHADRCLAGALRNGLTSMATATAWNHGGALEMVCEGMEVGLQVSRGRRDKSKPA